MEQDDLMTSVAWDRGAEVGTESVVDGPSVAAPMPEFSSTGTEVPGFSTHPANRPDSEAHERTKLQCRVTSPIKEAVGSRESYISYLITTRSTLQIFQKQEFSVRRRYNDFVHIHTMLTQRYGGSAVPPLPEKHASTYIKGGRFDSDFTSRRCNSLDRFLKRCCLHPELKKCKDLHIFLESGDWNSFTRSAHHTRRGTMDGNTSMIEGLTDSLMGAFTKLPKPDKRFIDIKIKAEKLARDLGQIEKLTAKITRRETDLEADFGEMSSHFAVLASIEPELQKEFHDFAKALSSASENFKKLKHETDISYLTSLQDQSAYNLSLKCLLKLRDQRQADYEALAENKTKTTFERDQLKSGHTNFIQTRVDNLRGLNHEAVRNEKIHKLDAMIQKLDKEFEEARTTSELLDREVLREVDIFERTKGIEMKESMQDFARANVKFYKSIIDDFSRVIGPEVKEAAATTDQ